MDNRVNSFFKSLKGKKIALCGAGISNSPLAEMFIECGAKVTVCDRRSPEQLGDSAASFIACGAELKLGNDYLDNLDVDIIFRTPGMKFTIDELDEYRKKGVVVTSEMEVFFDLCPAKIFAVTGSNGKTTTTTIISEFLKKQGKKVYLGGNIGKALMPSIKEMTEEDFAVVELSSFQLISMRKSPDIAVVTNLAPNHLDMHKDMAEYVDSKRNIYLHQNAFSRTVLNLDNDITAGFAPEVRGQLYYFSRNAVPAYGAFIDKKGDIYMAEGDKKTFVMNRSIIKIPGNHNVENYLAAISAVWGYADIETICDVAKEFGGVEHRAEFVRTVDGVKYFNDSIATSPSRTIQGTLSLYNEKIIIIAGGYDKKIPFDVLGPVVVDKVKAIVLMGVTAPKIEKAIKDAPNYTEGNPVIAYADSMEEAVAKARELAKEGDIVSLSPACASFDKYPNFEVRGKHFKDIVNSL